MEGEKMWESPFKIISIVNNERKILGSEYETPEVAQEDMLGIRAGVVKRLQRKKITKTIQNGILQVVDNKGVSVYNLKESCLPKI